MAILGLLNSLSPSGLSNIMALLRGPRPREPPLLGMRHWLGVEPIERESMSLPLLLAIFYLSCLSKPNLASSWEIGIWSPVTPVACLEYIFLL